MSDAERARELIPQYWLETPRSLPRNAGLHRWIWDLRYPAPQSVTHGFPISAVPHRTPREPYGPVAVPGEYRLRLSVDGHAYEQSLTVLQDPRTQLPGEALDHQLQLARELSELLTRTSGMLLTAQSEEQQLHARTGTPPGPVREYQDQLSKLLGSDPAAHDSGPAAQLTLPKLGTQLDALYKEVIAADAAPTASQVQAAHDSAQLVTDLTHRWEQLQQQLGAVNKTLRAAHQAPIRTDLAPARDVNAADED